MFAVAEWDREDVQDNAVVVGLATSPVWAPWLNDFNQTLTAITLVIGVIFGIARGVDWSIRKYRDYQVWRLTRKPQSL